MKRLLLFLFSCIIVLSIFNVKLTAQATAGQTDELQKTAEQPAETVKTTETETTLDKIVIKGTRMRKQDEIQTHTRSTMDRDMIDQLAGAARQNPFKALDMLPSVHSESTDAVGMLNDQNNIRVRGLYGDTFSKMSRTIEGCPIGANVGANFYGSPIDLDDLSHISLIRGPVPSDKGIGYGNSAGALDQIFMQPASDFGIDFHQNYGSNRFQRSFLRIDSGELPTKTRFFISGSNTEADKWRGPGKGERHNISAEITQTLPAGITMSFFQAYNNLKQHAYRALDSNQASDKSRYKEDFNPWRTGNPAQDKFYYDFNRQRCDEYLSILQMDYKPAKAYYLTLKPYYYKAEGHKLGYTSAASTTDNTITISDTVQEQYGFLTEFGINIGPTLAKVGYWYQTMDTMPPTKYSKKYDITSTGYLTFRSWGQITKYSRDRDFNSPYLMLNNRFGNFRVDTGIKYVRIALPSVTGYNTTSVPDVSYDDAFNYTTPIAGMHAGAHAMDAWLPYIGLNYEINQQLNARLTYGRNYASPWIGPMYSTYQSNIAAFQSHGISFQDFWDDIKLEISDNFDLGVTYDSGTWYLSPTLFYSRTRNKQIPNVYDPVLGISYYQNKAKTESKGAELEAGVSPFKGFTTFGSISYNSVTFTKDIQTKSNVVVECKGKQVTDTPEYMAKLGTKYTIWGFTASPIFRYLGKRYSDCLHYDKVDAYWLVDLSLSYTMKNAGKFDEVSFELNFINLFNKKYISIIHNYQDPVSIDQKTSASVDYFPGEPFTIIGGAKIKF